MKYKILEKLQKEFNEYDVLKVNQNFNWQTIVLRRGCINKTGLCFNEEAAELCHRFWNGTALYVLLFVHKRGDIVLKV